MPGMDNIPIYGKIKNTKEARDAAIEEHTPHIVTFFEKAGEDGAAAAGYVLKTFSSAEPEHIHAVGKVFHELNEKSAEADKNAIALRQKIHEANQKMVALQKVEEDLQKANVKLKTLQEELEGTQTEAEHYANVNIKEVERFNKTNAENEDLRKKLNFAQTEVDRVRQQTQNNLKLKEEMIKELYKERDALRIEAKGANTQVEKFKRQINDAQKDVEQLEEALKTQLDMSRAETEELKTKYEDNQEFIERMKDTKVKTEQDAQGAAETRKSLLTLHDNMMKREESAKKLEEEHKAKQKQLEEDYKAKHAKLSEVTVSLDREREEHSKKMQVENAQIEETKRQLKEEMRQLMDERAQHQKELEMQVASNRRHEYNVALDEALRTAVEGYEGMEDTSVNRMLFENKLKELKSEVERKYPGFALKPESVKVAAEKDVETFKKGFTIGELAWTNIMTTLKIVPKKNNLREVMAHALAPIEEPAAQHAQTFQPAAEKKKKSGIAWLFGDKTVDAVKEESKNMDKDSLMDRLRHGAKGSK
jgi:DNA repair exonuclease SbcCD ATPase subunit